VSKVLNLSVAAVKSRLHRGRLVLRSKLAKYME
jgi:DNA-directed RNA polymerase specialized sigma24 family protein